MLQQTRVDTVIPYFQRWMERFPTLADLADASQQEVLGLWEGLGYYSRARNLHKAAQIVMKNYSGVLPGDIQALSRLPGVGRYTAGAIASLAFGLDAPALDGNIRRVLARLFDVELPAGSPEGQKRLWELALQHLPHGKSADYNQGLMDLGSQVCTPRLPKCLECPLQEICEANARGLQQARPVRQPKTSPPHFIVTAAVIQRRGQVLIAQRPAAGLLGGLWEFPGGKLQPGEDLEACLRREICEELDAEVLVGEKLGVFKHAYTHFRITLHAFLLRARKWERTAPAGSSGFDLGASKAACGLPDGKDRPPDCQSAFRRMRGSHGRKFAYTKRAGESSSKLGPGELMLIVDAHEDIAYNALTFGRDYTLSAEQIRDREHGTDVPVNNDDAMLGWLDYQRGSVALVFATLFAPPARWRTGAWERLMYSSSLEAGLLYRQQLDYYERFVDENQGKFQRIFTRRDLEALLAHWKTPPAFNLDTGELVSSRPVGLLTLMEGADAVGEPGELEEWWQRGVRLIGPAWSGTRYSGGWREPGPLTSEGFALLERMAELGMGLDLSHMDETAAFQALDVFEGELLATHSNAHSLLKGDDSNRHLPDRLIRGILDRDGVIGVILFNAHLKAGWKRGDPRHEVGVERAVRQIDFICQMAGDARHVGLGSDFDGGFGLQSAPVGLESIADLQKFSSLLTEQGYSKEDCAAILGGNWLGKVRMILPEGV